VNKTLLRTVFKENRLRLSLPRLLIYQELAKTLRPVSPQDLYHGLQRKKRKIGLTSIYRALDLFESLGMAFKVIPGSNGKYQLCKMEDHHHHIICKICGQVVEFQFCDISRWSKKLMKATGYEMTGHQLSLYGVCESCRQAA